MSSDKVVRAYAHSLIELADEAKIDFASELTKLNEVINDSNDLENVLFLDVFSIEEKLAVVNDIANKISLNSLLKNYVSYLISEKRMNMFPSIYKEVIVIDDDRRGFLKGTIESSGDSVNNEDLEKLKTFLKNKLGKDAELNFVKNENITAGYKITVGDLQLDATVDNQLEQFRRNILSV